MMLCRSDENRDGVQFLLPFLPRLRYDKKQYFSVAGGNEYGSV